MRVETAAQLASAIEVCTPGARIVYHTGYLILDHEKDRQVADIGHYARVMAMRGKVLLMQRRLAHKSYEYIVVKAKTPRPLPPNLWVGIEKPRARKYKMALAA